MSDSPSTHKKALLVVCQFLGLVNVLFSKELGVVKRLHQLKVIRKTPAFSEQTLQGQDHLKLIKDIAQTKHLEENNLCYLML